MNVLADPWWPVVVLALVQVVDAILCFQPVRFVEQCLDDAGCPLWVRPWLSPVKAAAGGGLIAGLWISYLGTLTCIAVALYFAMAIGMHLKAHDIGRNLFNATGIMATSIAVAFCFG
jgi:hypothetical protein